MRTTLKRGLGQGASVNGNGRAVLPPTAPTPMRVYRQPVPERRTGLRLVGRMLIFLVVAILMLIAAFGGGWYLFLHESVAAINGKVQGRDWREALPREDRLSGAGGRDDVHRLRPQAERGLERPVTVGHDHAHPGRPEAARDLDALVPARHAGQHPLPGPACLPGQDQRRVLQLRLEGGRSRPSGR